MRHFHCAPRSSKLHDDLLLQAGFALQRRRRFKSVAFDDNAHWKIVDRVGDRRWWRHFGPNPQPMPAPNLPFLLPRPANLVDEFFENILAADESISNDARAHIPRYHELDVAV